MKTVENLDEVVEILRNTLIEQSELAPERVLNALSLTSTELDKLLDPEEPDEPIIPEEPETNLFVDDDIPILPPDEPETKPTQGETWDSIEQKDATMLFELLPINSTSSVSMEEGDYYNSSDLVCSPITICSPETIVGDVDIDESITYYKVYRLKLTIYGSDSSTIATNVASRMRSAKVRAGLYQSGIYIEQVTEPEIINEFKNNLIWLRNDIQVDIGVKYSVSQVAVDEQYETVNTIKIYRRK